MTGTKTTETKPATLTNCHCLTGTDQVCGSKTHKAFAQGHDARMSSRIATLIADGKLTEVQGVELIKKAGGGDLLVSKTVHSAKLRASRGISEKAPRAKKSEPEQAAKVPTIVGKSAKVFHGKRSFNATVVRNAAEELVARHRLNSQNCDHAVDVTDEGDIMTGQAL